MEFQQNTPHLQSSQVNFIRPPPAGLSAIASAIAFFISSPSKTIKMKTKYSIKKIKRQINSSRGVKLEKTIRKAERKLLEILTEAYTKNSSVDTMTGAIGRGVGSF